MAKILVIDDDIMVAQMIVDCLALENHCVEVAYDGLEGWEKLKYYSYDVAVIDWNLPSLSGTALLKRYRQNGGNISVLMLTAKGKITEKEEGFAAGADDYLTKPFDIREFAMRVKALLRRPSCYTDPLSCGRIKLDYQTHSVIRDSEHISLLPGEFSLLEFLMRNPDRYFSPNVLLDTVWKSDAESTMDALRSCIKRIRQKIDKEGEPSIISTSRGLGYKFEKR